MLIFIGIIAFFISGSYYAFSDNPPSYMRNILSLSILYLSICALFLYHSDSFFSPIYTSYFFVFAILLAAYVNNIKEEEEEEE